MTNKAIIWFFVSPLAAMELQKLPKATRQENGFMMKMCRYNKELEEEVIQHLMATNRGDVLFGKPVCSLLHLTAKRDYSAVVQLLLDRGAFVDIRTTDGQTALMMAADAFKTNKTIRILLRYGADPLLQIPRRLYTALAFASCNLDLLSTHLCAELLDVHHKKRAHVLQERSKEKPIVQTWLTLQTEVNSAKRRALETQLKQMRLRHALDILDYRGNTPIMLALEQKNIYAIEGIARCLSYEKIIKIIPFSRENNSYIALLTALIQPSNYASIVAEALAHNNQELISDLDKTAKLIWSLFSKSHENLVENIESLTYTEIKEFIVIARRWSRHDIFLQALASSEHYKSIYHDALAENNHELIRNLEKVQMAKQDHS